MTETAISHRHFASLIGYKAHNIKSVITLRRWSFPKDDYIVDDIPIEGSRHRLVVFNVHTSEAREVIVDHENSQDIRMCSRMLRFRPQTLRHNLRSHKWTKERNCLFYTEFMEQVGDYVIYDVFWYDAQYKMMRNSIVYFRDR